MSRRKHPKGFRPIVVRDRQFCWEFRAGLEDSVLVVVGPERSGCRLVATLRGWQDPWLNISGYTVVDRKMHLRSSVRNTPSVISPGFVRRVIEDALDSGWDPRARTSEQRLEYRDGVRVK